MAAFTRSVDGILSSHGETTTILANQQKAIDDLYAKVAEIQRRIQQQ